jgi:hypothetical protein
VVSFGRPPCLEANFPKEGRSREGKGFDNKDDSRDLSTKGKEREATENSITFFLFESLFLKMLIVVDTRSARTLTPAGRSLVNSHNGAGLQNRVQRAIDGAYKEWKDALIGPS